METPLLGIIMELRTAKRTTNKTPYLLTFIAVACLTLISCSDSSVSEPEMDNQFNTPVKSTGTSFPTPSPTMVAASTPTNKPKHTPIPETQSMESVTVMDKSLDLEEVAGTVDALDSEEVQEIAEALDLEDIQDIADDLSLDDIQDIAKALGLEDIPETTEDLDLEDLLKNLESIDCASLTDPIQRMGCDIAQHIDIEDVMDTPTSIGLDQHDTHTDHAPKLKNLMLQNLGPWDSASATFGDMKFDSRYGRTVFDDFGMIHNPGETRQYDNPTFEFAAPADSIVLAPISGVITMLTWQPTAGYKQDDWDIIIAPSMGSKWRVNLDHVVSIDCDRTGSAPIFCDLPLTIDGDPVTEGTIIDAGQVLGYVGNLPDRTNSGINGRTELSFFEYVRKAESPMEDFGVINHCPTMHLDDSVESVFKAKIQNLMDNYEAWAGNSSIYPQDEMVSPGCRYRAIEELDGVTAPIMN